VLVLVRSGSEIRHDDGYCSRKESGRDVLLVAICETRAVPAGRGLPLCSRGYVEAPFVALLSDTSQGTVIVARGA
jgi:hypothetical protein